MTISDTVKSFVNFVIEHSDAKKIDEIYLTNKILDIINLKEFDENAKSVDNISSLNLMDNLVNYALLNNKQANTDIIGSKLMDLLLPLPSKFNEIFWQKYKQDHEYATSYFYEISKIVNYIKTREIAKNIEFPYQSDYGNLKITINLSKPEKDPKQIANQKEVTNFSYPKCQLCLENEGYSGRLDYPARTNHRVIQLQLGNETWGFQYSPYAYFNEHSIVFAKKHRPMKITKENIARLFEFVQMFPNYFIGSNADLPIVGGSILTHDHFQAGRSKMPMDDAIIEREFKIPNLKLKKAGILKWPMSVIRLIDSDIDKLIEATFCIKQKWEFYDDIDQDIISHDKKGNRRHTITPIVRKKDENYEIDIVLRDNNVSKDYPDGIFHPHKDVQHIKKENIGLIEVMGLAVLPPRLKNEMLQVENYLLDSNKEINKIHKSWADNIKQKYSQITKENVQKIINNELGNVFVRVLEDAGVFKRNQSGQNSFDKFIASLKL